MQYVNGSGDQLHAQLLVYITTCCDQSGKKNMSNCYQQKVFYNKECRTNAEKRLISIHANKYSCKQLQKKKLFFPQKWKNKI